MPQFIIFCLLLSSFVQFEVVFSSTSNYLCHLEEALSLLHFKKEMLHINSSLASSICEYHGRYSYPKMISWNKTTSDCCAWEGVKCHEITGHVISLDLSCSRLMGVIHQNSSLLGLSLLCDLNLAYNKFYPSKIPTNIGGLSSLTHLNFSHSGFCRIIPSELSHLSKLVLLDLSDNYKLSFCPQCFKNLLRNLTNIRVLSLYDMQIATSLPANWSSSSLTYLDLGYTQVHGKLSRSVFRLPRLKTLILVGNENLTVSLPKSNHSNALSLQVLDLSYTIISIDGLCDSFRSFPSLITLALSRCGLSGSFPNSIGNLSEIVQLYLSDNNFNGIIPPIISNLPKIEEVDLGWNSFTGQFPSNIWNLTQMAKLWLHHNLLSGPLPFNMSVLPKLRSLQISYNAFEGTIPSWLFSSPSLSFLCLNNNRFRGHVEDFNAKSLVLIDLSSNNLNGSIEFTMFTHLSKLQYLQLSDNKLSFKIVNETNISFPNLLLLGLSSSEIKEFPSFLNNSNDLEYLELSNNNLFDQIPYFIFWNTITYLNLSHNSLSSLGSLGTLDLMNSLQVLDLRFNKFQERLPLSICSSKELYILDLSHNNFTGAIPKCFESLSSGLEVLNLAKNDLKGSLAMKFPKDNSLLNLNLNGNLLEGPLPISLANCKYLKVLDVGNNKINENFPNSLENLTDLQVLILKSNRFFGSISNVKNEMFFAKVRVFDISCNEFTGPLPLELLKSFKTMITLDKIEPGASYMGSVTRGYLNEFYPYSISFIMKGLSVEFAGILTTLVVLDLSSNKFTGDIPESIGNLNSLIVLNLSLNNFSGHIPSALGKLRFLETLDLSWNRFEGAIPWQLVDLTSLEILNLSQNHLMGRIPQGKQFNTFLNESYYGNLGLCGFPVTMNCGEIDQSLRPSQGSYQNDEESCFWCGFTWKTVFIGYNFGVVFGFAIGCLLFIIGKPKWIVRNMEKISFCSEEKEWVRS